MADTVDSLVVFAGNRRRVVRLTNVSDGTGESAVTKVDISTLSLKNGVAPTAVAVEGIVYNIQGFSSVRLFWDHTTNDEISVLSGSGVKDYTNVGGLMDPRSAGDTGDILLTTAGGASGSVYDITLFLKLKD